MTVLDRLAKKGLRPAPAWPAGAWRYRAAAETRGLRHRADDARARSDRVTGPPRSPVSPAACPTPRQGAAHGHWNHLEKPPGTDRLCFSLSCFSPLSPSRPFRPRPRWRPPAGPTGPRRRRSCSGRRSGSAGAWPRWGRWPGWARCARGGASGGVLAGAAQALRDAALGSTADALIAAGPARLPDRQAPPCSTLLCWVLLAASTTVLLCPAAPPHLLSLLAHGDPKVPERARGGQPGRGRRVLRARDPLPDRHQRGNPGPCSTRRNSRRSRPTSGPTSARGTTWCCFRSAPWARLSPLPPRPASARRGGAAGGDARRRPRAASPA